jgi:hypothetical protein
MARADETRSRMMPSKDGATTLWVWGLCREDALVFIIQPSRSKQHAFELRRDIEGILVCDGYAACAALEDLRDRKPEMFDHSMPNFELGGCWSHTRPGVHKAAVHADDALIGLELIDALFTVERRAREAAEAEPTLDLVARRVAWRKHESEALIERLYDWAYKNAPASWLAARQSDRLLAEPKKTAV